MSFNLTTLHKEYQLYKCLPNDPLCLTYFCPIELFCLTIQSAKWLILLKKCLRALAEVLKVINAMCFKLAASYITKVFKCLIIMENEQC